MTKRKFAAFDIDGTLFRSGLYREVIFEMMKQSAVPKSLAEQTEINYQKWKNREHSTAFEDFETALTTSLDEDIRAINPKAYDEAVKTVVEQQLGNVYIYTRKLLEGLKKQNYFLLAISGSQEELVEAIAARYGFDAWIGQRWVRQNNRFTGEIIKTHTGKDTLLKQCVEQHNLTLEDSIAVGDSRGDRGMLSLVDNPIAFNPTTELLEIAKESHWQIVIERKSIAYTLRYNKQHGLYLLETTDSR